MLLVLWYVKQHFSKKSFTMMAGHLCMYKTANGFRVFEKISSSPAMHIKSKCHRKYL